MEKALENVYDFSCKRKRASLSTASEKRQDNLLTNLTLIIYIMLCNSCFVMSVWLHGFVSFSVHEVPVEGFEEIS